MKKKMIICSRGNFGRLVIFLILLGILLSYLGSRRSDDATPSVGDNTTPIAIEPAGQAVLSEKYEPDVDYFIDYRLERDSARQQQLDLLREMINNPNSGEEARKEADRRFLHITDVLGKEMEIEGLIRAKGFTDALILLNETSATAIIKAQTLNELEVTRIADIIVRITGLNPAAISVVTYAQ